MSDTDTDDTDLLLLIPPNYYTDTADRLMREIKMNAAVADENAAADAFAMPPPPAPTTAAYQFLMPSKKTELNHINARLQNIEIDEHRFDAPSDISTISTNTVRTAKQQRDLHGMVHSTPKSGSVEPPRMRRNEDNILLEIDNYLDDQHAWQQHNHQHHSDDYLRMRGNSGQSHESQQAATSLPSIRLGASVSGENKLISLSDLWGKSNLAGTVVANNAISLHGSPSLKEEQYRRQHLERMVQTLQTQLLEYQQRISVAIEVDRSKDAALQQADQQSKTLNFEVQHLRDSLHKLEVERNDSLARADALQHELSQAVGLATKFQEKTDNLETELERCRRQANEAAQGKEELELQLQSSKRVEELSHGELNKLRDRFAKMDYQQEKVRQKQNTFLKSLSSS